MGGNAKKGDGEFTANDRADGGEFHRGGEDASDVGHDRIGREHGSAEIALQNTFHVKKELLVVGQVEAHFFPHTGDDMRRSAVADNCQYGVDRHHAADEEGYGQKAHIGRDDDNQKTGYRRGNG